MSPTGTKKDIAHIRAELQQVILAGYGEDLPPIPDDVPILDLGVSSLELVEGMRRVYDHFGVLISIRRVIEGQITLGSLALYIEQELNNPQPVKIKAAEEKQWDIEREIPLAPSQQHLAFLARYADEAGAAFNEALVVRLRGTLDGPALHTAIDEVGNRYEALRSALTPDNNTLNLGSGEALELDLSTVEEADLQQRLNEIVARPFVLGRRLFRAELLRLSDTNHVLVLVGHSLVLEQQALAMVLNDIAEIYRRFSQDKDATALPPTLQWTDYLAMGETPEAKTAQTQAEAYWKNVFAAGAPKLELPADFARPAVKKYIGARNTLTLAPTLTGRLKEWAAAQGVSVEQVLSAAFSAFIQRMTSTTEIVIGVESEPLYLDTGIQVVARTRNMLPLRTDFQPAASFAEHVRGWAELIKQSNQYRHLSLAELIQLVHPNRDQSRSALFTTAFRSWTQAKVPAFEGLEASILPSPSAGARYDIELIAISAESGLSLVCDYSPELFEAATITRWLEGLVALLEAGLTNDSQPCATLPLMSAKARERLLVEWNKTEKTQPALTVLDLTIEQSEIQYEQTAIRFGENSLTYGQLLKRVDEIASALHGRGVGHADRVGILMKRSLDLLPTLLAVWRLGALYIPMDTNFPRSRLAYMLTDSNPKAIVTNRALLGLLDETQSVKALCIEDVSSQIDPTVKRLAPATSADSAYIMYTSGSTGNPKGVEILHSGLTNVMLAAKEHSNFTANDSMLALTTISFDISTAEIYMPLIAGGSIEIGEDGLVADGFKLIERIESSKPTHMQLTPSGWKMLLAAGWRGDRELCLIACGEAVSRDLGEQMVKKGRVFLNFYGPTETTVYSSLYKVESAPGAPMRIGKPLANTQFYVLDANLQPLPVGAVGDLYIGGDGLAVGYWQRPALTSEKFIPAIFDSRISNIGTRLYRTGDLARYLPNGDIICLGRIDDQVKIHGVRIELGEVEVALRSISGVRDAVVTSWADQRGDTQLVGHVIPNQAGALIASGLRGRLRERLPEVMIPPYILFAESFPLTANGKVRRASLPTPTADGQTGPATAASEPPKTDTEKALAKAWAAVLDIDLASIGRDSDFLDLGGHSLLMTLLVLEIRKSFRVVFSLREFFDYSTLSKLAALIDERRVDEEPDEAQAAPPPATRADQTADWARQRMAYLEREAELPHYIAPARGLTYQAPKELRKVFLTGATGFLGVYMVSEILKTTQAELYCLVRPKRGEDGKQRIEKQMRRYDVWSSDPTWQAAWDSRLNIVEGDVTLPRLGIQGELYDKLAVEIDAIFHSAAHVNFIYPYEALRATNVLGIHEIIQFAFHLRIKQVHHLSTAAIWPMGAQFTYYEKDPIKHNGILNLGYDEAKWVGEQCMLNAEERGLPVARYRPGEVGGDSISGHCVTDHFVVACVKGFLQFGAFPDLDIEVDIAPVDYVAKAMIYLAFNRKPLGRAYHLTNPRREKLSDGMAYLRKQGYQFEVLPFEEIRDRLLSSPNFSQNALFAYQAALEDMNDVSMQLPIYDTRDAERALTGSGIQCAAADQKLFETYLRYLQKIGFIPQPEELVVG